MPEAVRIVLASGSRIRRALLQAAGLTFDVVPAMVDEDHAKREMLAEGPPALPSAIATRLAVLKASEVSGRSPGTIVIGADQVLECEGRLYSKPADKAAARAQLATLRNRTHALHSAVSLVRDGVVEARLVDTARLTMRPFSDAFLDHYLDTAGDRVLASVGAYELEGLGVQLFDRIEGDYFTVLGLPILPLLAELRRRGVVTS